MFTRFAPGTLSLLIAGMTLLVGVSAALGASSESVTLTVTIQNLSVAVSPASKDFGVIAAGSTDNITSGAIGVTNDGNVAEKLQFDISSAPAWTSVVGLPGAEQYRLSCLFKSSQAAGGDFDKTKGSGDTEDDMIVDGTPETCVGYNGGSPSSDNFASSDNEDGHNMATGVTHHLYFDFDAPSTTTTVTQQTIVLTVTALAM